jgi:adenylate cyclase
MSDGATVKNARSPEEELEFRREIEKYYLPEQLVDAIYDLGEIPKYSINTHIGIGFIDIADYTFISKFLSPNENQSVLNGLYTALNWVIKRHGGYLNKIEGDSLMFHFGGLTDPNIKGISEEESINYIARELFYTCVEMQRVVSLFNQANDKFIFEEADESVKDALRKAFDITGTMRNSLELSAAFNALFQIRVRIGANIGEVTLGNFGPDGAKQWDVVGLPVIDAKRMEATAPIGGLRISQHLFEILEKAGIAGAYFERFKREAQALFSSFKNITREELFGFGKVTLSDKRGVQFNTYSVQVSPGLPESIGEQVKLLLEKGEAGADRIVEFLQYYRGNKFVIHAVEKVFEEIKVELRKDHMLKIVYGQKYKAILKDQDNDVEKARQYVNKHYTLYDLLEKMGLYQDKVNTIEPFKEFKPEFRDYDQFMEQQTKMLKRSFVASEKAELMRLYFYEVIYPLLFRSVRTSILEYQLAPKEANLEEL